MNQQSTQGLSIVVVEKDRERTMLIVDGLRADRIKPILDAAAEGIANPAIVLIRRPKAAARAALAAAPEAQPAPDWKNSRNSSRSVVMSSFS